MTKIDPLVQALLDCESRLSAWLNESELNADLFRRDPWPPCVPPILVCMKVCWANWKKR
jgi:hypothetical protein